MLIDSQPSRLIQSKPVNPSRGMLEHGARAKRNIIIVICVFLSVRTMWSSTYGPAVFNVNASRCRVQHSSPMLKI
jgi:hypothetical protein